MTATQWTALFIGLGVSALLAFIAKVTTWMTMVSDNHLAHIQKACEETSQHVCEVKEAVKFNGAREQEHHEFLMDMLQMAGRKK